MLKQYTSTQLELLDMVKSSGASELAEKFMLIHDIALYHSDYTIKEIEKTALYQVKLMSEILTKISKEV
jgi:hypothetical protein